MKNIKIIAPLMALIHKIFIIKYKIKPSKLYNSVDTTILTCKKEESINKKDWQKNRVTTRIKDNKKFRYCGSKSLVFMNKKKQIYFASLLNINFSDQNILKSTEFYKEQLNGFMLMDRGFSNKLVRKRILPYCKIISPYKKSEKKELTTKEIKLYKKRWQIETLFKQLKQTYDNFNINLQGTYSFTLAKAKFFSSILIYNSSTV